jgi:hypothetical protein
VRRGAAAILEPEMPRVEALPPDAVPLHVPDFDLVPPEAAASQSEGSVMAIRVVPLSAAAQSAGAAPVARRRMAEVPIVLSIRSSCPFRRVVDFCKAIGLSFPGWLYQLKR